MISRSVIVHLSEPPWAHARDATRWRTGVFEPIVDAICAGEIPTGLVLGGRLAEDLSTTDPGRLKCLQDAIEEGRVLLVATPLHHAALSSIPGRDAIGQLRAHITLMKRVFGVRPEGCWLPFSSWDPTLPRVLRKAGLEWTFLDGDWLTSVAAPRASVLTVERDGHAVAVLRARQVAHDGLIVCAPCSADDVPFVLEVLSLPRETPELQLLAPRARAYLPLGGPDGIWESRLLVDAGADVLHKTMQRVSRAVRRLEQAVEESAHSDSGPDPLRLEQAHRYLYRSQNGSAYGGSGCSTALRDRAWRDLVRAEKITETELGTRLPRVDVADLDCDGAAEVRLRTSAWSVTLAPASGGTLTELTQRSGAVNVVCGVLPMAFREAFDQGRPVGDAWDLVTTETPGEGLARAILVTDSELDGVPVRITKGVQVGESGPLHLRLEVHNRGMDAARGRLSTEVFLALGGRRWSDDDHEPLTVEVAGGKEPLDEVVELPPLEAIGVAGWRARVDFEMRPPAAVHLEPLVDGLARLELSWPVELFVRDRERREIKLFVRESPDG